MALLNSACFSLSYTALLLIHMFYNISLIFGLVGHSCWGYNPQPSMFPETVKRLFLLQWHSFKPIINTSGIELSKYRYYPLIKKLLMFIF